MKTIIVLPRIAMLLRGLEFYGLTEVAGVENNPQILQFFKDIGHTWVQDDETAWCSAFINWLAWDCGCERSGELDARSWLSIGKEIIKPQLGHIVILWRERRDSWKGHVTLFMSQTDHIVYGFGGNQDNQANTKPYPKTQILGYREVDYIR